MTFRMTTVFINHLFRHSLHKRSRIDLKMSVDQVRMGRKTEPFNKFMHEIRKLKLEFETTEMRPSNTNSERN